MSETVVSKRSFSIPVDFGGRRVRQAAIPCAIVALAHLPLLISLARRLWAAEHYQFFPLILLGAAYLAYVGLRSFEGAGASRWWLRGVLLAVSCGVLVSAVLLSSPWPAGIAAMLALWSLAYGIGGSPLVACLWRAWFFLWLAVPLPLGLDRQLILYLQTVATRWASQTLDLLGYRHLVAGVVIELPGQSFLVEEACSGIHSLFAALACVVFYLLLVHRGFVRSVLLILATVCWVVVANAVRVTLVTMLSTKWGLPVTEGFLHAFLGAAVFAAVLGVVVSTDRLLLFLVPAKRFLPEFSATLQRTRRRRSGLSFFRTSSRKRHKTTRGRRRKTTTTRTIADDGGKPDSPHSQSSGNGNEDAPSPWLPRFTRIEYMIIAVLYTLALGLQLAHPGQPTVSSGRQLSQLQQGTEEMLPEEWNGWTRTGFRSVTPKTGRTDEFHSLIHTYEKGSQIASVSLDGPFVGWHDQTICVENQGWSVASVTHRDYREIGEALPGGFTEILAQDGTGRHSLTAFAVFDAENRPMPPIRTYAQFRAVERFPQFSEFLSKITRQDNRGVAAYDSGTFQVRVFATSYTPLSPEDITGICSLFHHMRRIVTNQPQVSGRVNLTSTAAR